MYQSRRGLSKMSIILLGKVCGIETTQHLSSSYFSLANLKVNHYATEVTFKYHR